MQNQGRYEVCDYQELGVRHIPTPMKLEMTIAPICRCTRFSGDWTYDGAFDRNGGVWGFITDMYGSI